MKFFHSGFRRPAVLVGLALGLGACGTTYGTGVNPGTQTVKDLTGIFSLGGGGKSSVPIAYEPRPPIVAPPDTGALPPPGSGETVENWPNDPDVMRREQAFANANTRTDSGSALVDPGFRLSKQPVVPREEETLDDQLLSLTGKKQEQQKLFAAAKGGAAGKVDAEGNPVRTALTEPPAEYRIPDPSAPDVLQAAENEGFSLFKKKRNAPSPSSMGGGTDDIADPDLSGDSQTQTLSQAP